MEFNIDAKSMTVYIKLSFYDFKDLKWLKENLWFELMKRWFAFIGRRYDVKSNSDN